MTQKKYVHQKSKQTAVILAVFFGLWSWLYTYKYDAWKFWICLVPLFFLFWTIIVPVGVWAWAVIDQANKDKRLFEDYYK